MTASSICVTEKYQVLWENVGANSVRPHLLACMNLRLYKPCRSPNGTSYFCKAEIAPLPYIVCALNYSTLLPFAVSLNFAPRTPAAPLHMSIRCKKISKYSSMEQMFSSIFKFRVITFFSSFTFNFASVTA